MKNPPFCRKCRRGIFASYREKSPTGKAGSDKEVNPTEICGILFVILLYKLEFVSGLKQSTFLIISLLLLQKALAQQSVENDHGFS